MAMKIGKEYSSERITAKDFEQLAEEAGLGKALVRRRVPDVAATVNDALAKIEIANPTAEKVAAQIKQRCDKTLNSCKN
jgi:serine/threonine-protein kinase HipA